MQTIILHKLTKFRFFFLHHIVCVFQRSSLPSSLMWIPKQFAKNSTADLVQFTVEYPLWAMPLGLFMQCTISLKTKTIRGNCHAICYCIHLVHLFTWGYALFSTVALLTWTFFFIRNTKNWMNWIEAKCLLIEQYKWVKLIHFMKLGRAHARRSPLMFVVVPFTCRWKVSDWLWLHSMDLLGFLIRISAE